LSVGVLQEAKTEGWVVAIVDVASGWLVGKLYHHCKNWYARSMRDMPTSTRTWYET
jgi:hypothetical protein